METFIGREKELSELKGIYDLSGPKVCAVFGRRRIGKSTLLEKFCENKRSLTIQSFQSSAFENLEQIQMTVSEF